MSYTRDRGRGPGRVLAKVGGITLRPWQVQVMQAFADLVSARIEAAAATNPLGLIGPLHRGALAAQRLRRAEIQRLAEQSVAGLGRGLLIGLGRQELRPDLRRQPDRRRHLPTLR